jgi:hypothetical protein
VNCAIALNVEAADVIEDELLERWHPSPGAPEPPDQGFLADRYERASGWTKED